MLKINHPYLEEDVIRSLQLANPSKKQTDHRCIELWRTYLQEITFAIRKSIRMAPQAEIDQDQIPIEWLKLSNKLGHCRRFHYLNWFHAHFPLVNIIRKGTPGELTMIKMKYDLEFSEQDFEIAAASKTSQACFEYLYNDYRDILIAWIDSGYNTELVDWVPLDRASLEAYILANSSEQVNSQVPEHIRTLKRNMVMAIDLYQCADFCQQQELGFGIPQIVSESEFGRRYYRGLNLQNVSKIVRHAALGTCYQYDIDTSVFSWQYHITKTIDPQFPAPATLEYLDHKRAIRNKLARELQIPTSFGYRVERVKEIITAIGFGADAENVERYWLEGDRWQQPSIQTIIKDPRARRLLLADPWIREFVKEQQKMRKLIVGYFRKELDSDQFLHQHGKFTANKILAYLYQHDERFQIEQLARNSREQGDFLLLVHDGFYTRRPQRLLELRECLQQINPWASISVDPHPGYTFHDDRAHKEFIKEEERRANQGQIPDKIGKNNEKIMKSALLPKNNKEFYQSHKIQAEYQPELDPFLESTDNEIQNNKIPTIN